MEKEDGKKTIRAKPFLKWAGGKSQLISALSERLPETIKKTKEINTYIEPFIGGGAIFFYLKSNYRIIKSIIIDVNPELVLSYQVIQKDHKKLILKLKKIEEEYLPLKESQRKEYFYDVRTSYNENLSNVNFQSYGKSWIDRTAQMIFLNRTCFNGLFRQNSKGEFNVPFGKYKNPQICNERNITEVHWGLKDTEIICGDFNKAKKFVRKNCLIYLDPPYRPINPTSSFTSYAKDGFNDDDQRRLADFYKQMDKKSAFLMLSNSDPRNENPKDDFFDRLYSKFIIERVPAKRNINCNADKRGEINELIIRNYKTE
jgi:DNA adenine methylase